MMDCKKALEETDGDVEAAKQWLREKGLAASAKRDDRESAQGVVALLIDGNVGGIVKLKCETDFVASSEHFKAEADDLAQLVVAKGTDAVGRAQRPPRRPQDHAQGEHQLGDVVRIEAAAGNVLDCYVHIQGGRGVNGVLVEMTGATPSSPTTSPCTSPSPGRSTSAATTCPKTWSTHERATLETISRNEGKPEQALAEDHRGSPRRLLQGRRACSTSPTPRTTRCPSPS